jgi:eukaryotic-like serine/threonine-protein kinase
VAIAPIKDVELLGLAGTSLISPDEDGVEYRLERVIGEGAHGIVFLASRRASEGAQPAVVKVLRPRAVRELAELAAAAIRKEVSALQRLSDQTPPTPFVVRFLGAGTLEIRGNALKLPWLAVEYVDGALQGTTLRARVMRSMSERGLGFDLRRARTAIHCMTEGIAAIHDVGVVHRDVNPRNVLCSGEEQTEVFKIADFGLARVSSVTTFGSVLLGTPGYCAPEQSFPDQIGVGSYTDVFSLACCAYFVLTGQAYFDAPSIPEMLVAVYSPSRRSLLDGAGLCPELRADQAACAELDRILARATAPDPRQRPQSATEFGALLSEQLAQRNDVSLSA